jgi:hypothetical protein
MKHRIVEALQKCLLNPPIKLTFALKFAPRWQDKRVVSILLLLWKATNFHRSGRRSAGKRKGALLSTVPVPSRISAPVSTLAAFQRIVLAAANAFGETLPGGTSGTDGDATVGRRIREVRGSDVTLGMLWRMP